MTYLQPSKGQTLVSHQPLIFEVHSSQNMAQEGLPVHQKRITTKNYQN